MNTLSKNTFSSEQVIQLCRRYIVVKKHMIQAGLAGIASILIVVKIILSFSATEGSAGLTSILTFGFIIFKYTGYAFASTMFSELNSPATAPQYLTLPASTSEKLASAWLISYAAYTAVGLASLYILSLILEVGADGFFTTQTLYEVWSYTIIHSIFLFGAIYFRSNNFLNTLLAFIGVTGVVVLLFFAQSYFFISSDKFMNGIEALFSYSTLTTIAIALFSTTILSGIFISFTYLRLKNREIA